MNEVIGFSVQSPADIETTTKSYSYSKIITPIATSTSILNHKRLHLNRNSIASQDTLQNVTEWKTKHQHPTRKGESFRETLQQNSLYKVQRLSTAVQWFCFLPWCRWIPSCWKHFLARHTRTCLAGTPCLWNGESWNKQDSWTLKIAFCFFLLDFSNKCHLWELYLWISGLLQWFYLLHSSLCQPAIKVPGE